MLKRVVLCAALAAVFALPAAMAADGPPIGGSVADFSRIDPPLPAPGVGFTDGSGRKVDLADFRGKVVLLNLWATWCPPCKAEMPSLDRLQARLGGPGFTVLPVSIDEGGGPAVALFYAGQDISRLGVYLDPAERLLDRLGADAVPVSYLIDRDGRLVGKLLGMADWDSPDAIRLIRYYMRQAPAAPPTPDILPTAAPGRAQRVGIGFSPL